MTSILESAIEFAAIAHAGQLRKGTDIPYIIHPYTVGMYLKEAGCDDEVIAAGILHDVLEDTPATNEDLKIKFGERVEELVNAVSEPDKTMTWEARKQQTITSLKTASNAVRIIACADKLHNLRTVIEAVEQYGEPAWERFKRGRKEQEWYYRALGDVLESNDGSGLFFEFSNAVDRCFGSNCWAIHDYNAVVKESLNGAYINPQIKCIEVETEDGGLWFPKEVITDIGRLKWASGFYGYEGLVEVEGNEVDVCIEMVNEDGDSFGSISTAIESVLDTLKHEAELIEHAAISQVYGDEKDILLSSPESRIKAIKKELHVTWVMVKYDGVTITNTNSSEYYC